MVARRRTVLERLERAEKESLVRRITAFAALTPIIHFLEIKKQNHALSD
jgi:hypothetical protein